MLHLKLCVSEEDLGIQYPAVYLLSQILELYLLVFHHLLFSLSEVFVSLSRPFFFVSFQVQRLLLKLGFTFLNLFFVFVLQLVKTIVEPINVSAQEDIEETAID